MTVLSRGARVRRGGRRPGWVLLTALLVLALGASSALVFTNRVELLKLAVILALWAAVAGAFVSVLYRRQSDADQSRVRDLKLVYDLQLDREISARREYELTVESQLRRELTTELRAQSADDVAALRAELNALRTSLEILFDTDLKQRPALETLETESPRDGAYTDWAGDSESTPVDWVSSDRVTSVPSDGPTSRTDESSIIDVPEEPLLPPRQSPLTRERTRFHYEAPEQNAYLGASEESPYLRVPEETRYGIPEESPYLAAPDESPYLGAPQEDPYAAAPREPEPRFDPHHLGPPAPELQPEPQMQDWQPLVADGQWLPPGAPGSHWTGGDGPGAPAGEPSGRRRRARHFTADEPVDGAPVEPEPSRPYGESGRRSRSRHSAEYRDYGVRNFTAMNEGPGAPPSVSAPAAAGSPPPPPATPPPAAGPPRLAPPLPPEPAPRHRGADPLPERLDDSEDGTQTGGQSVADLLARFQIEPSGGGRRRRRDS